MKLMFFILTTWMTAQSHAHVMGLMRLSGYDSENRPCSLEMTFENNRVAALTFEGTMILRPGGSDETALLEERARLSVDFRTDSTLEKKEGALRGKYILTATRSSRDLHQRLSVEVNYARGTFEFTRAVYVKPHLVAERTFINCKALVTSRLGIGNEAIR